MNEWMIEFLLLGSSSDLIRGQSLTPSLIEKVYKCQNQFVGPGANLTFSFYFEMKGIDQYLLKLQYTPNTMEN